LHSFLVDSDDDALSGLDTADAIGSLLAIDGTVVGLEAKISDSRGVDSGREGVRGVVEESSESSSLGGGHGEALRSGPGVAVESEQGTLGDSSSSDELVIDI